MIILEIFFIFLSAFAAVLSLFSLINMDYSYFNPIRNRERWDNLNWLGIWCGTILIIMLFYPVAICYGIYNLFHWLFTVGRKK